MIILKKDNHYEHTLDTDKAMKMAQDGYEIVKGKSLLSSIEKQSKPKRKSMLKSRKK